MRGCDGTDAQKWDWVGSDTSKQLKNKKTDRCLMTDDLNEINAVWTSTCKVIDGQKWIFSGTYLTVRLTGAALRTSPNQGAVYTDKPYLGVERSKWQGWHT